MRSNSNKGFTLIELLVVIAIIGILSSVVLSALNTARGKGNNAAIKRNLSGTRAQAELFYDSNSNDYNGLCGAAPSAGGIKSIRTQFDAANAASRATAAPGYTGASSQTDTTTSVCHAQAGSWAVSVPLKVSEGTANYWCVDAAGISAARVNPLAGGAYACPAT